MPTLDKKIDATRGAGDWADDAVALLDALGIEQAHLVGNSLGGVVVWRLLADAPQRFLSATVVDPGSPYGFGGTKDVGRHALLRRLRRLRRRADRRAGGRGGQGRRPQPGEPFRLPRRAAQAGLQAALHARLARKTCCRRRCRIHIGEQDYPGDKVLSPNWPFVAPGVWGAANALSPKYVGEAVERMLAGPAQAAGAVGARQP